MNEEKMLEVLKASGEDPILFCKYVLQFPFKLSAGQEKILREVYNPDYEVEIVEIIVGRKGTKSTIATVIELFEIYKTLRIPDPHKHYGLLPGQNIYCLNFAPTSDQAIGITVNYAVAMALNSWWMSRYLLNYDWRRHTVRPYDELRFPKGLRLKAMSSSSRAGRGWAVRTGILDEGAWFQATGGNQSGDQIIAAVRPNVKLFKRDGKIVIISTPAGKSGMFWENYEKVALGK